MAISETTVTGSPANVRGGPELPQREGETVTAGPYVVERTALDRLLRHDISDEDLGSLGDMRRDYLWEGKWVALGVATGAAPNAIAALWRSYLSVPAVLIEIVDLVQIVFMFVGFAIWVVLHFVVKDKTKVAADLVTAIRERTARRVQG